MEPQPHRPGVKWLPQGTQVLNGQPGRNRGQLTPSAELFAKADLSESCPTRGLFISEVTRSHCEGPLG